MKRVAVLEPELANDPAIAADWPGAQWLLAQWPEQWDEVSVRPGFWEMAGKEVYGGMAYQFTRGAIDVALCLDRDALRAAARSDYRERCVKRVEEFFERAPSLAREREAVSA